MGLRGPASCLAAVAVAALAEPAFAQGCALCRENLEQGGSQGLQDGFFYSILLLISLPLLLVGTFALLVRRAAKKAAGPKGPMVPGAGIEPATRGL